MILCIWVHGYEEGTGDVQGQGIGTALLEAAEADARSLGAKGMAAWGLRVPIWMRAGWFKAHGYDRADTRAIQELVWKPFSNDATPPSWVDESPVELGSPDKVSVTAYKSGWCPATAARRAPQLRQDQEDDQTANRRIGRPNT